MGPVFLLFLIALVGVIALASAIQYFLRPGPWTALGYASLGVFIFMLFAVTGLWADGNKYDWGPLTAIFAIMLLGAFIAVKCGRYIWKRWHDRKF